LIFADSSFLVSLYLPNDRFSAAARTIAISFRDAVAYPLQNQIQSVEANLGKLKTAIAKL
jgi:hypothetical protein